MRGSLSPRILHVGGHRTRLASYTDDVLNCGAGDYPIVSLTITENGYHYRGDDRNLDLDHPAIAHGLAGPHAPLSAVGFVCRVAQVRLAARRTLPNSMVDRITSATTDEDRAYVRDRWAIQDGWPVFCEEFRQWYVQESFADGRPAWEVAGAEFVPDVIPFELMKI